jgi:hypothetical protein
MLFPTAELFHMHSNTKHSPLSPTSPLASVLLFSPWSRQGTLVLQQGPGGHCIFHMGILRGVAQLFIFISTYQL